MLDGKRPGANSRKPSEKQRPLKLLGLPSWTQAVSIRVPRLGLGGGNIYMYACRTNQGPW